MLKWTLGNKLPPTPGLASSSEACEQNEISKMHVARNRQGNGAVRKASIRALRRLRENKENIHPISPRKKNSSTVQTVLQDVSNSSGSCNKTTPKRRLNRRNSHPLRFPPENGDEADQPTHTDVCDVLDTRGPPSTIKTLPAMQIEYSPGPLTATQSLLSLRRRLTHSMQESFDNPLSFARRQNGLGVTIPTESSPSFESFLEEKSIFDQTGVNRSAFVSALQSENSKFESTLMSSLSQKLEWLRLNNSNNSRTIRKQNQGIALDKCKNSRPLNDNHDDINIRRVKKRRKEDTTCDESAENKRSFICDSKIKTESAGRNLIGLTLPMGIPSPSASDDSGLSSLQGLEGIQPLNISPIRPPLSETVLSSLSGPIESIQTSLLANKCSPSSSTTTLKMSPSSIGSSCRKRLNDEEMELNGSSEDMITIGKTPKMAAGSQISVHLTETPHSTASPLAMVEKRSRSRRCLRFVSPGISRRKTGLTTSSNTSQLKSAFSEIELRIYSQHNMLTIHIGRGFELHKPGGKACNAYAKVALVPSCERTFFRTPVHRESSCPNFDERFSFELQPEDVHKRILVSVWHRDRENRKSEFLGCVSLAVKNAVKKEIVGSFRLASQPYSRPVSTRSNSPASAVMARKIECVPGEDVLSAETDEDQPRARIRDDNSFLRHLELENEIEPGKPGRTLFTITKCLTKSSTVGFGLSIAWTQPPRIERVEAGQAADRAGIRPGDFVIFVEKRNVVTMSEDQVLQLIRSCGNELNLEIYRKPSTNGVVEPTSWTSDVSSTAALSGRLMRQQTQTQSPPRSGGTTSTSCDLNKRRLNLPHVAFSTEYPPSSQDARRRTFYQLLNKEQQYAVNLQFGVNRFLLPLAERKDFLNATEHHTLFQNIEELYRLTDDIIEQAAQDDVESIEAFINRVYFKKIGALTSAYRKYCAGIKRADCLLVEKSKNSEFTRFCSEPVIPKKQPDLTMFLHKPLEHYRELLKLMTTMLNQSKSSDEDSNALTRLVHELQTSYREATASTGLMEPEVDGRPLLSVQDLESRLVFTRCKPFVLSTPGRQWIFGGDLSRVEGRAVRQFWALLFTDILMFAKVSRDRVLFITEEPLPLISVSQAFFNIRKKATEFRLLINNGPSGIDSPATAICGPDLSRTPKKSGKTRSIALRAPTLELKAVWQNLIQRQIIYLNTARGGTPASSPLESPDPPTTLTMSAGTLDSLSFRRQTPVPEAKSCFPIRGNRNLDHSKGSTKQLNDLIDQKCRQLGKTKTSKGGAMHLAEWMKGQLGGNGEILEESIRQESDQEQEFWSQEEMKKRTTQLLVSGYLGNRNESRCEEIDVNSERSLSRNTERSHQSFSTSESQTTVKSNPAPISVCRQCRDTCLKCDSYEDDDFDESWGNPLRACTNNEAMRDPFIPAISVMPPTPDRSARGGNWDSSTRNRCVHGEGSISAPCSPVPIILRPSSRISEIIEGDEDEDTPEGSVQSSDIGLPYRTLSSSLKRFGTLASLERIGSDDILDEEDKPPSTKEEDTAIFYSPQPIRASLNKKTQEIYQRSWVSPLESHPPTQGWTSRAGSFVAEKMALFEKISSGETTASVKKTSFLDRYLKPSSENHLDSPPDPGTNTSSSGRGEDEGETSGATSGEEVWGTPTSGGEIDDELIGESAALTFVDSPQDSSGEDTEQLMEDLLTSLPMLAARTPGLSLRRRLDPLPEEDDTESSSAPCSPKPLSEVAAEQDRASLGYHISHHDNCIKFGTSSTERPLGSQRNKGYSRPRIGTIDRALGIRSDEEIDDDDEEDEEKSSAVSQSIFRRLVLRRNRDDSRKSNRLEKRNSQEKNYIFESMQSKVQSISCRLKTVIGELPRPAYLNTNLLRPPILRLRVQRMMNQLRKRSEVHQITMIPNPNIRSAKRIRNAIVPIELLNNFRKKRDWLGSPPPRRPLRRKNGIRQNPCVSLDFLSGKKCEPTRNNSAAYGGRPLFKYLFNRDTVEDIPTTLPRPFNPVREDGKQMERRFWKQLRRRRSNCNVLEEKAPPPQVAV